MGNICSSNQEGDTPLEDIPETTRKKGRKTKDGADGNIFSSKQEGATPLAEMPATTRKKGMKTKDRTEEPNKKEQNEYNMPKASKSNFRQWKTYENPPDTRGSTESSGKYVAAKRHSTPISVSQTYTEGQWTTYKNRPDTRRSTESSDKYVVDKRHSTTISVSQTHTERLKKELTEKTTEIKDIKEELASARKENKDITDRSSEALSQRDAQISRLKTQLVTLNEAKDTLLTRRSEAPSQGDAQISTLKSQLEKLNEEIKALYSSSLAGARLLDNNPNIADLSDANRPTKLAEQYFELYDNEWTDAYSALEDDGLSENQCMELLLNMLITIYRTCEGKADSQNKGVYAAVAEFIKDAPLPPELSKHLKESRKKNYKEYMPQLKQSVKANLSKLELMTEHRLRMTDMFLEKSLTICWLMCIQDPPVYIDCNVHIRGQKFQNSSYREYTKSGPIVDFVVWPVVYLQKDGAMLCKGTAQCTALKDDSASIEDKKQVKVGQFSRSLYSQIFNRSGVKNKQSNQVVRQSAPVNPTITPTEEGTGKSMEFNAKGGNRNGSNAKEGKDMPDVYSAEQSEADARTETKKNSISIYVKHGDRKVKNTHVESPEL